MTMTATGSSSVPSVIIIIIINGQKIHNANKLKNVWQHKIDKLALTVSDKITLY